MSSFSFKGSPGAVAGIAVGAGLLGFILGFLLSLLMLRQRRRPHDEEVSHEKAPEPISELRPSPRPARTGPPRLSLARLSLTSFGVHSNAHSPRTAFEEESAARDAVPRIRPRPSSTAPVVPVRPVSPNLTLVETASLKSPRQPQRGVKLKFSVTSLEGTVIDEEERRSRREGHRRVRSGSSSAAVGPCWADEVAAATLSMGPLPTTMPMLPPTAPLQLRKKSDADIAAGVGAGAGREHADAERARHEVDVMASSRHDDGRRAAESRRPAPARAWSTAALTTHRPREAWETPFLPSAPWTKPQPQPQPEGRAATGTSAPSSTWANVPTAHSNSGSDFRTRTYDTDPSASGTDGPRYTPRPLRRSLRDEAGLMSLSLSTSRDGSSDAMHGSLCANAHPDLRPPSGDRHITEGGSTEVHGGCLPPRSYLHELSREEREVHGWPSEARSRSSWDSTAEGMDRAALTTYAHPNGLTHLPPPMPPGAPLLSPRLRLAPGSESSASSGNGSGSGSSGAGKDKREGAVSRWASRPLTADSREDYVDALSVLGSTEGSGEGDGCASPGGTQEVLADVPDDDGGVEPAGRSLPGLYDPRSSCLNVGPGIGEGNGLGPAPGSPTATRSVRSSYRSNTGSIAGSASRHAYASVKMERQSVPLLSSDISDAHPAAPQRQPRPQSLSQGQPQSRSRSTPRTRPHGLTILPAPYLSPHGAGSSPSAPSRPLVPACSLAATHPRRFSRVAGTGRVLAVAPRPTMAGTPTSPTFSVGGATEESEAGALSEPLGMLERIVERFPAREARPGWF